MNGRFGRECFDVHPGRGAALRRGGCAPKLIGMKGRAARGPVPRAAARGGHKEKASLARAR